MRRMEWLLLLKKVKKLAVYRFDFTIGIISSLLHSIVAFVFITSYYNLVPDIAGWEQEQVVYMYFSVSFMQSLFQGVYCGMIGFSQNYVKTGDLDIILVKPINELRYILLHDINISELPSMILNFIILILSVQKLNMAMWEMAILICMPFLGVQIMYSISIMINCLSFQFIDTLMGIKFLIAIFVTILFHAIVHKMWYFCLGKYCGTGT